MRKRRSALPAQAGAKPIAVYEQMRTAVDAAASLAETREVRHRIEAIRRYAREAQNAELEILAAEARLYAERKAGEFLLVALDKGERRGRGKSSKPELLATLDDLGITKKQSAAWQQIARISEDEFDARLQRLRGLRKPVSTNGFLASGAAMSSHSDEWLTPPEIIDAVIAVMGEIDLDPCSNGRRARANVPARTHFIQADDGLTRPWAGRVYMNPPYGNAVSAWVARLVHDYKAGDVEEAIALLAARTDTAWFRHFDAPVCFIAGRLKFSTNEGAGSFLSTAPFPSAVFYLGPRRQRFAEVFRQFGPIYMRVSAHNEDGA